MKQVMHTLLLILLIVGCSGKNSSIHQLTVLEVYEENVKANDGVVENDWRTLCEVDNGSRTVLRGKYGVPGDTLIMKYGSRTFDYDVWYVVNN